MKNRIIALIGALVLLLTFFTACGNDGTQQGAKPDSKNDPQLVIAANPVFVFDDGTTAVAYNDMNAAMAKDSKASTLTAIADSNWAWAYEREEGVWPDRAVYGFNRWTSGNGTQAKGVYSYAYNEAGSISVGLYNAKSHELVTYQNEAIPEVGVLLSAVVGQEEALLYTVPQDGTVTIPAGTLTAIEQVAGVKTGFLAEDGTARSASVRILVNSAQVYSGTLANSTAAEDGVAVTQLSYPQINDLPVKAGDTILIGLKLDAQANSDEDVTEPTIDEEKNWQVVRKSTQVAVEDDGKKNESDVTASDGSILMITDYQFTFTLVRDKAYEAMATEFANTIMKRTAAEVFSAKDGAAEDKYEIIIGVHPNRSESKKIYEEVKGARLDNADDYIIRLVGTKIYIVGANDQALQKALNFFLDTFVADDQGKIPAKYNYYNKPAHVTYLLADQNIASYTIRTERYPSLVTQRAAEAVQKAVLADCGYIIPIKPMNLAGTDVGANEIRIGPMNGAVKVDRIYDTRFNSTNWESGYRSFGTDGMLTGDYGIYTVAFNGKNVEVKGGSSYAVNVGTMKFLADLKKSKSVATSYTTSGDYESYYDYKLMYEYDTVDFSMADGFGLTYSEDFDYYGTDKEKDKAVRTKWWVMTDNTNSLSQDGDEDMYQYRPGVYGDNWWVAADTAGNSYLFEVTKKRTMQYEGSDHGWDSVRLCTEGFWGFRYGIWETRLVMGTRNGSCSSVWAATGLPYQRVGAYHEIDVYENYGRDIFVPCTHHNQDGNYVGNYHFQAPYYQEACWLTPNDGEHYYDTFHHVAIDWTYDHIDFYFDGECVSAMSMFNNADFKYYRTGIIIKLANGVGTKYYCNMNEQGKHNKLPAHIPEYWMSQYGGDINDFFEVQLVDYTRVYQTDNDTIEYRQAENEMKFTASFGKSK